MMSNFFTIVFRNLLKHKLFTGINVLCLTLGLLCSATIGIYVYEEWNVDRFHANNDRLYRVITQYKTTYGQLDRLSTVGRALPKTIVDQVAEVQSAVPVLTSKMAVKHNGQYHFEKSLIVGEDFLSAFSYKIKYGDSRTCLVEPNSIVITDQLAQKFFPTREDALGQTLILQDSIPFVITGILQDVEPSHISFDLLISHSSLKALGDNSEAWFQWDTYCYVLLDPAASRTDAENKISALSMKFNEAQYKNAGYDVGHKLESVKDIYLHSSLGGINTTLGNSNHLIIFSLVGTFILLLACINFINLFTALSASRAKEIGVRKTNGASRAGLLKQFLGESLFYSFVSGVIAFGLIPIILPLVEKITGRYYSDEVMYQPLPLVGFITLLVLAGLLAGWYPALVLSRLKPTDSLKGKIGSLLTASAFRKSLVVIQFAVTSLLLTGTIVILSQLDFMQNQTLGFNKNKVLLLDARKLPRKTFGESYEILKSELLSLPSIQSASATGSVPGTLGWKGQIAGAEGRKDPITLEVIPADYDFPKTMELNLVSGRMLSQESPADLKQGVLINESACKAFGWTPEEAIGKAVSTYGMNDGRIVGVLKDYHHHGLKEDITPLMSFIFKSGFNYMAIKFDGDVKTVLAHVEKVWKKHHEGYTAEFLFLDDNYNMQYRAEEQAYTLLLILTFCSFIITCLGLFGMTTFVMQKQIKEIGIRKILGATSVSIVRLISSQFVGLILIALSIGLVCSVLVMNKWLEGFAHRISIGAGIMITSSAIIVVIALVTVSIQSLKAATMNPVKSLRNE